MRSAKKEVSEPANTARVDAFTLLDEAVWKIKFLRDTAVNGGIDSERSPGLTEDGGAGLAVILSGVIENIEKASTLLTHSN
jgi:hypothetical protein